MAVILKIRGKGPPERFVHFLRKVLLVTAHAHNSQSAERAAVCRAPHSPSAPSAGEPLQEPSLKANSVNGDEVTADHMIKAFADAESLEPQKARPYMSSSPSQCLGSDPA